MVYYSFFDTVINDYLIKQGGLDPAGGEVIGLAVETHCEFKESLNFPQLIDAGMRVAKLGSSSVTYEIGLFALGSDSAAAMGHFVHVFVDRGNRRPVELPPRLRASLAELLVSGTSLGG